MEINFALGKNGGYIPSSLGGRSISLGRQTVSGWDKKFVIWQLQFSEFLNIDQFSSKLELQRSVCLSFPDIISFMEV